MLRYPGAIGAPSTRRDFRRCWPSRASAHPRLAPHDQYSGPTVLLGVSTPWFGRAAVRSAPTAILSSAERSRVTWRGRCADDRREADRPLLAVRQLRRLLAGIFEPRGFSRAPARFANGLSATRPLRSRRGSSALANIRVVKGFLPGRSTRAAGRWAFSISILIPARRDRGARTAVRPGFTGGVVVFDDYGGKCSTSRASRG